MRILLLKAQLVGKRNHVQGDTIDVDKQLGESLVKRGIALAINVVGPTDLPEDETTQKREAVVIPRGRRAVQDV